jgi:hypothetical protein
VDKEPEDLFRGIYFETIDAALCCLANRFQSKAFKLVCSMESVVVDLINADTNSNVDLQIITDHYGNDVNGDRLKLHLKMFSDLYRSSDSIQHRIESINDVVKSLQANEAWMALLPELVNFLRLFLVIPATSCTAERSFSCLRRLKTYLRSTMSQKRLNHVAVINCYRNQADEIDLKDIFNNFIARNDIRASTFATFHK